MKELLNLETVLAESVEAHKAMTPDEALVRRVLARAEKRRKRLHVSALCFMGASTVAGMAGVLYVASLSSHLQLTIGLALFYAVGGLAGAYGLIRKGGEHHA